MQDNIRIDKYLWSTRIFKTRSLATEECKKGHIIIDDVSVKPSRIVKIGDKIEIKVPPIIRSFIVIDLIEKRVSASLAKNFISEITPEEEFLKLKLAKNTYVSRDKGAGRPTKKERRQINEFKNDEL